MLTEASPEKSGCCHLYRFHFETSVVDDSEMELVDAVLAPPIGDKLFA